MLIEIMAAIAGLWSIVGGTAQVSEHGCYCVAPWESEYVSWFIDPVRPVDPAHDGICSGQAGDYDCYPYPYQP